ncbi:MAG TPA: TatD family hydrolase [Armatimonadota bacterium]|nr:TatD family hydrolase [Armatimonadota bacterium]
MINGLIDTHCHLNSPHFAGRVEDVLLRAENAGIAAVVLPGWNHSSSVTALAMSAGYRNLFPAVGLHPWYVAQEPNLDWLPHLLDDPRVIAVGEIGVDGAIDGYDPALQEQVFRTQLSLARERDLPVLIHCRRGWDRVLACLRETPGIRGVIHAFSGSLDILQACVQLGLYISFAGMVTRPNSRRAHEAALHAPADRILLETDAPYMALDGVPADQAEPAYLPRVLAYIASLRQQDPDALARQIAENTQALFRIDEEAV